MFLESRQLPPLISVTQVHNSVRSKFESNLVLYRKYLSPGGNFYFSYRWSPCLLKSSFEILCSEEGNSTWPSHVSNSTQRHFLPSAAAFCNSIWIIEQHIGNTLQNITYTDPAMEIDIDTLKQWPARISILDFTSRSRVIFISLSLLDLDFQSFLFHFHFAISSNFYFTSTASSFF